MRLDLLLNGEPVDALARVPVAASAVPLPPHATRVAHVGGRVQCVRARHSARGELMLLLACGSRWRVRPCKLHSA